MSMPREYWASMLVCNPEDAIRRQIGWLDEQLHQTDAEIRKLEYLKENRQHLVDDIAMFEAALAKLEGCHICGRPLDGPGSDTCSAVHG
jgi:hypothetical protein